MGIVFWVTFFLVEIDVKDDLLLKNEVFLTKNVIFVYKGPIVDFVKFLGKLSFQ